MPITVISPESRDERELPALEAMFLSGLERYHVRKPGWSARDLESWILLLPPAWRPRLILHEHHSLVERLGLGGRHEKDRPGQARGESRSCHDLASLRQAMGRYNEVIFGPIFPSLSKPGYGPPPDFPWEELRGVLSGSEERERSSVIAIGGITPGGLERCFALGFDGAAVIGAVWRQARPEQAYLELRARAETLWGARHAA